MDGAIRWLSTQVSKPVYNKSDLLIGGFDMDYVLLNHRYIIIFPHLHSDLPRLFQLVFPHADNTSLRSVQALHPSFRNSLFTN